MWKFTYIRADREEVEMGPYATQEEAKEERDKMAGFGAICCLEPFEVPGEAPSREGSYVDKKVGRFATYFQKEMATLAERGVTYNIFYDFLNTTMRRIKLFIQQGTPFVPSEDELEECPKDNVQEWITQRDEYLFKVADIIKNQARSYSPLDGSVWESLGKRLSQLAEEVKAGEITPYQLFVVVAQHNTGHGESQTAIQVTENPFIAVKTAKTVEELGYEFYADETGVSVYRFEMDRRYQKEEFKFPNTGLRLPPDYPVIFYRRKKWKGKWEEE